MAARRPRHITYRFPERETEATAFMDALIALLAPAAGARVEGRALHLAPEQLAGALPATTLTLAPIACPEIVFATDQVLDLALGSLHLRSDIVAAKEMSEAIPLGAQPPSLPLTTVAERLAGHITHVDHTGVNLPTSMVDDDRWGALLRILAQSSALYRYPDGEPWPFIIPASDDEFQDDIRTFPVGRLPKFELVHDALATLPVLQFSLGTDLSREELEARLPNPYGVAFPDLGHIFRTVYVDHPWPRLTIRLDLNYAGPVTDWDTGEWLVKAGGRIT
jgi:hypothetical protein